MRMRIIVATACLFAVVLAGLGYGAFVLHERRQVGLQVRAEVTKHLSEQFEPDVGKLKDVHIDGNDVLAMVDIAGHEVRGTLLAIRDSGGAYLAPSPEFDEAMHSTLRNDLMRTFNSSSRTGYS